MRRANAHLPLPRLLVQSVRGLALWLALWLPMWLALCSAVATPALAQGVELSSLQLGREDAALTLEYSARLKLSHALEDALKRGVPMYFVAQATVWRSRWYWRDERIAQINRSWRLSYQPLSASWRLSLGGLAQSFPSLGEALAPLSRVTGWRLAELERLDPAALHYVEFSFQLDNSQLPQPMQIDLGSDWKLGIARSLAVPGP